MARQEGGRGGRRSRLFAFTEHGVAMLFRWPSVARLRQFLATHQDLAKKLEELEEKYDDQFREVLDAIWALMEVREEKRGRTMGFVRTYNIKKRRGL